MTKAEPIMNNLEKIINSNKENFMFFCKLFSNDYTKLSDTNKQEIIKQINSYFESDTRD